MQTHPDLWMPMIGHRRHRGRTLQRVARGAGRVRAGFATAHGARAGGGLVQGRIVPMPTKMKHVGKETKAESIVDYVVERDECNRSRHDHRRLALAEAGEGRRQVRHRGQRVATVGRSAAAALVVMEAKAAEKAGLEPLGRLKRVSPSRSCNPDEMGIGPVFAVPRLLERHGLKVSDIELWELNEAFASQCPYSRQTRHRPRNLQRQRRLHLHRPPLRHDRRPLRRPRAAGRAEAQNQTRGGDHVRRWRHGRRVVGSFLNADHSTHRPNLKAVITDRSELTLSVSKDDGLRWSVFLLHIHRRTVRCG